GPYAASIGRLVWGRAPSWMSVRVTRGAEVDVAFSLLAEFGAGRVLAGHFGFTVEYRNWLLLAGAGTSVEVPLAFSTPPETDTARVVRRTDVTSTIRVPAASAMRAFVDAVLAAIARRDGTRFAAALLADARVRSAFA